VAVTYLSGIVHPAPLCPFFVHFLKALISQGYMR